MRQVTVHLLLLFLFLLLHPLTSKDLEANEVEVEVIVDSTPCSVTCGLGVRTQTLCLMRDGNRAIEDDGRSTGGTEVSEKCRVRKVNCVESWQCGLRTMTVTSGEKVEIDCLGEVMKEIGRFSWRVSWRYARGLISSDDSLFNQWEAPLLDRLILDPVREEDAGTYSCVVQDADFRRVKMIYWGIRVLPPNILNLDYESSLAHWDQPNQSVPDQHDHWMVFLCTMLIFVSLVVVGAGLMLVPRLDSEDEEDQAV